MSADADIPGVLWTQKYIVTNELYYREGNDKRELREWRNKLSQYYMNERAVHSTLKATRLTKSTSQNDKNRAVAQYHTR
jgi:hypothetical protein